MTTLEGLPKYDRRVMPVRRSRTLLFCLVVSSALAGLVYAASPVRVIVNGVDLGPAAQGRIIEGQVMVPLQAVAEALGADVR